MTSGTAVAEVEYLDTCTEIPSAAQASCPVCRVRPATSPHHIRPRAVGGADDSRNIVWFCKVCHDIVEEIYDSTGREYSPELAEWIRRGCLQTSESPVERCKRKAREAGARFYARNSDRVIERQIAVNKKRKEEHPEEYRVYMREYNRNRKTKHSAEHREYMRNWFRKQRNEERTSVYF